MTGGRDRACERLRRLLRPLYADLNSFSFAPRWGQEQERVVEELVDALLDAAEEDAQGALDEHAADYHGRSSR